MIIKILFTIILFTVCTFSQPNNEFDRIIEKCKKSYSEVKNYSCTFSRKEVIDGSLQIENNIIFKFMKPAHFYMKWTEGKDKNQELVYVYGKYGNKLVVKPGGFFNFLRIGIDPDGKRALEKNRHPIYEADLGYFINLFEREYLRAKNDVLFKISFENEQVLNGRSVAILKSVFPENKNFYSNLIYIFIDKYYFLPIKIKVFDWNNKMIEEYQYDNLRINSGITENDFETGGPDINY
jgi:outer membrane lipoprotein-sorting protein